MPSPKPCCTTAVIKVASVRVVKVRFIVSDSLWNFSLSEFAGSPTLFSFNFQLNINAETENGNDWTNGCCSQNSKTLCRTQCIPEAEAHCKNKWHSHGTSCDSSGIPADVHKLFRRQEGQDETKGIPRNQNVHDVEVIDQFQNA